MRDWYFFVMGTTAGMLIALCLYILGTIVRVR